MADRFIKQAEYASAIAIAVSPMISKIEAKRWSTHIIIRRDQEVSLKFALDVEIT